MEVKTEFETNCTDIKEEDKKFICDCSLIRVAKHLRMMGYDCVTENDATIHYLLYAAQKSNRIIITKSKKLVAMVHSRIKKAEKEKKFYESMKLEDSSEDEEDFEADVNYKYVLLDTNDVKKQIKVIVDLFKIEFDQKLIFSRCLDCNTLVKSIEKEKVKGYVRDGIYDKYSEFYYCEKCKKYYWGTERGKEHVNYLSALSFTKEYSYKKEDLIE